MNIRTTILAAFVIMILMPICAATTPQELYDFLEQDTTDQSEWTPFYNCGFFARDLARNASEHNITIGGLILGNHPRFLGYDNTIVNYMIIEDIFIVIDPQTDQLYGLNHALSHDGMTFEYYRTYTDGTNVPSFWRPLYYTGRVNE